MGFNYRFRSDLQATEVQMIPDVLKRSQAEIRQTDPTGQAIEYPAETWRRHLNPEEDLEYLVVKCPSPIARRDIFELSAVAKASLSLHAVRRLFIGTTLFGYGTVGYGPWRTKQMLTTYLANSILQRSFGLVLERRLVDAYQVLSQLRYCKSSFVTKFLYFAGFGVGMKDYPLILDQNVEKALRTSIGMEISHQDPKGYLRYVDAMHSWARELDCEAHNIEFFLWSLA